MIMTKIYKAALAARVCEEWQTALDARVKLNENSARFQSERRNAQLMFDTRAFNKILSIRLRLYDGILASILVAVLAGTT